MGVVRLSESAVVAVVVDTVSYKLPMATLCQALEGPYPGISRELAAVDSGAPSQCSPTEAIFS